MRTLARIFIPAVLAVLCARGLLAGAELFGSYVGADGVRILLVVTLAVLLRKVFDEELQAMGLIERDKKESDDA